MVMPDRRLEVPYESPEDRMAREDRELGVDPRLFGVARRVSREALRQARDAAERKKNGTQNPVMGSSKNVDVGTGRGTTNFGPAKTAPKRATKPPVTRNTASEYVAPPSPESAQTAGIQGLPGGQSGVSQEAGSDYGRTTYFGETPEAATQVAQQMRKGLFGEEISQEDYDAMTQRNKDASFYGRFKKGGQVKKKTAKKASGGSVSSASKRGDGCCQRGKTKGRMV